MKKWLRLITVLTLAVMTLSPLVGTGGFAPAKAQDDTFTIAWIPKALNNPVFELGRDGCMAAAEQLSAEVGRPVECLYMGSVNSDMAEQARVIEDAISQGVDAIGVSCNDPDGCVDPINAAIAAGIPVMTWDSDSPDSGRFTYLGVDNYTGGRAAANLLMKEMGTSGKVAVLTGVPGAFNLEERIRGFMDGIAGTDIEVVATVACNDDINLGVQVVEETMLANPDLNGWFFVGLWPVFAGQGAMPLFEDAVRNNNLKAVAFDTLEVELEWVQDGLLHGLVGQKYWGWGYDTVYMLYDYAVNGKQFPDWTDSGMDIVTINNVEAMAEAWATRDFTKPLPPAYPPEDDTFTIAWIPKALNNPVFELGRDGCMKAAEDASATYGIQVECLYMGSVNSDMAEQARVIEDAISQGVDAIGVSCNDPDGCVDPINAAIAAGIPVMTWDSDSPDSGRFTYLGVDNYTGGWAAGELLVRAMGEQGKVAVLTGVPGAFNLEERMRGFKDYVAQYPGIEIVATVACNDDINLGVQVVEETMLANPDLNGWFFVGLWPVFAGQGAMPLFEDAVRNNNLKAVAFDTLEVELEWVQDGLLHGLVGQKYWGWGYDTVYMLYDYAVNGKQFPDWTDSGMDIVTINNVEAMTEAWATRDFTKPLPPAYPPEDGAFTIAWIPKALNNPVFELGRDGCMKAAEDASATYGIQVECLYMGSVNSDMAEQARVIEDAISQGVDAIGVSCNDPDGCVDPINAAIAAGIPVMTWDSDSPDSGRFTYLGVDNYTGGWAAGELLVRAMGEQGKVAVLTGVPGAFNLEERMRGFKDYVAQYPGIEIVATVACNDDINLGVQVVEETMLANPDLNGWFFVGLWPVFAGQGAMPLFEDAVRNNNLKAVAFDTLPVELEWVQDGLLHGLVGQKYWGWGYDTVFMLLNHVMNLYPYPDWTDSGMDIVTINNVEAMAEAWATSDFTKPLPPAFPE